MEIACRHCHTRVNIPDEKIPKGKKVSFACPKCKEKIHILPEQSQNAAPPPSQPGGIHKTPPVEGLTSPQQPTAEYDASDKPFDFLDANAKTALLCIATPQALDVAHATLNRMDYHIEKVADLITALKRMRYHLFDVIIIDEAFDQAQRGWAHLLRYLNDMDMSSRRKIVVMLLSNRLRSMDNMGSFHLSVNQILNLGQIDGMESLIQRTLKEHDQFYSIFNETLRKLGKAT